MNQLIIILSILIMEVFLMDPQYSRQRTMDSTAHSRQSGHIAAWTRYQGNPIFPSVEGTWMESQTANPDLLLVNDLYFLFFRGQRGTWRSWPICSPAIWRPSASGATPMCFTG